MKNNRIVLSPVSSQTSLLLSHFTVVHVMLLVFQHVSLDVRPQKNNHKQKQQGMSV